MVIILKNIVDVYDVFVSMMYFVFVDYNGFFVNVRVFFSQSYSKVNFKIVVENIFGLGFRLGIFSDVLKKVYDEVFIFQWGV